MNLLERYHHIQQDITQTARQHARNPKDITLIAVSKTIPWPHIQPIYAAGCREFGESRLQEGLPKIAEAPNDIHWHLIGTLQKNKVRKAIGTFALIHSVDTPELAQKISECSLEMQTTTSVLLQVNTSGESTKHGLDESGWRTALDSLLELKGVKIEGLMTMAPYVQDVKIIRRCFERLRLFRDELSQKDKRIHHLSMGMSHDYRIAIAEGATLLRIGSALFKEYIQDFSEDSG